MSQPLAQQIVNPAIPALGAVPGGGVAFFSKLIPALLGVLMVGGAVVFVFMLILGGIEWITAGGDKGKIEGARQRVSNALIGLVVLFSFFAILNLVECFFGIGLRSVTVAAFNVTFAGTPVCR